MVSQALGCRIVCRLGTTIGQRAVSELTSTGLDSEYGELAVEFIEQLLHESNLYLSNFSRLAQLVTAGL